jgi:hypothetical protein
MNLDSPEQFEIGRVASRAFGVLGRNWQTFLALAAILTLPILLVTLYNAQTNPLAGAEASTQPAVALAQAMQNLKSAGLTMLVGAVFAFVLQAGLVQGTITDLNGTRPSLGACLSTGFKVFLPLLAIAILAYLGMIAGLILLIVPGIMLALSWSVVVPVKVVENTGIFESFGRSRALTSGHRWKILGLVVIYILIVFGIQMVVALLSGASLLRPNAASAGAAYLILAWIVRIPLTALGAVGAASLYYELRLVKEGIAPAQLAAAFD